MDMEPPIQSLACIMPSTAPKKHLQYQIVGGKKTTKKNRIQTDVKTVLVSFIPRDNMPDCPAVFCHSESLTQFC